MNWGTSYWRFIHLFSFYGERELVLQIKDFLPCEDCKSEWYEPEASYNLLDWSRELHNKVNKKLGKYANWDATDLAISHKFHCDICEKKEIYTMFPWHFMHIISKQPNSMEFLKEFNKKYPCEVHRGLLLDEPQTGETTLDWTFRNHERIDTDFKREIYNYVFTVPPCNDCPQDTL